MTEFPPSEQPTPETERAAALHAVVEHYFPGDKDFFGDMDEEDLLGAVYGQLQLETDEDPDDVFFRFGVTEASDEV